MDNVLNVKTEEGKEINIEVLDIVEGNYNGTSKEYIVYSIQNNDKILISILNEKEDSYSIDNIESREEYDYVQNLLLKNIEGDIDGRE